MSPHHGALARALLASLLVVGCAPLATAATTQPAETSLPTMGLQQTQLPPTASALPPGPATAPPTATPRSTSTDPEEPPAAAPAPEEPPPTSQAATRPGFFSREELISDARQLAEAIESAHPDPYTRGGGKIAFHRRLHQLLNAIPEGGMAREGFIRLLRPFVAAVGDAHTEIWSDYRVNDYTPGGVPLRFGIVEQLLYVAGVPEGLDRDLIGATLVAVEGVPLANLLQRVKAQQGTENEYQALQLLADEFLWYKPYMADLLPEWGGGSSVTVELRSPGGRAREVVFSLPQIMDTLVTPPSQVSLPAATSTGFTYDLLDAQGETAYLRVDHMTGFREAVEMQTGQPAPGRPSVTETFRSMVEQMREAGTGTLLIDLRANRGGNSIMGDILLYYLYGKDTLLDVQLEAARIGGGMVRKYSDLFWEQTESWTSLEQVNEGRALPLRAADYDFSGEYPPDVLESPERKAEAIAHTERVWLTRSATFRAEYESGQYSGHYCPQSVLVLTTPWTFSSGFTMAKELYLAGATLVGTPSGQAANSFGNGQLWHLDHTGIEGTVSTTYNVEFPDDSEKARILPVGFELTYDQLASYGFDPNAAFLFAMEHSWR